MNQVSKLLIVLQLVLSIMFMAFAAAVYTTGTNWKTVADKTDAQLKTAQASLADQQNKNDQLREENANQIKALEQESQSHLADANNYKTQLDELLGTDGDPGQLAKVRTERDVAQAEAKVASEEAAARVAEANALRAENRKLSSQVDSLVTAGRQRDDENLELSRRVAAAISKDLVDQATIAKLSTLLRLNGVDPNTKVDASGELIAEGREPVEMVDGKVLSTRRNKSGSTEFVYVSLGQDDAVEVGNRLHIYRGRKFVADIILREVDTDGAVGIVDEKLRNGIIKRGDNVTSKL